MKSFVKRKCIRRLIKIKSSDRALPDTEWILTFTENGLRVRRLGEHKEHEMAISWRSVIGHVLIHRGVKV
jgi:hypothetical protein